jgi:hypothetical protein
MISDHNENDANIDVQASNWPRNPIIHLNKKKLELSRQQRRLRKNKTFSSQ